MSVCRATGALSGLAAAAIFPPLQRAFGLKAAGCVGISWQLLCLVGGTAPAVLASLGLLQLDGQLLSGVLLGGLVASRCGLWLFDLAVCQLQQDYVEPGQLGEEHGHLCAKWCCCACVLPLCYRCTADLEAICMIPHAAMYGGRSQCFLVCHRCCDRRANQCAEPV